MNDFKPVLFENIYDIYREVSTVAMFDIHHDIYCEVYKDTSASFSVALRNAVYDEVLK